MRRLVHVVAFSSGVLFALGLALSGMTQPSKIVDFLDVAGAWDPTLLLVMAGAVGVHAGFVWLARRRAAPVLAERFEWPSRTRIDVPLVTGAALFGIGWGLSGFCPGPALVSLGALAPRTLLFVASMTGAALATRAIRARAVTRQSGSIR